MTDDRIVPLHVIEDEATNLGFELTARDAKFLLLGYTLGRDAVKLQDEEHVRFLTRTLLPDTTPNGNPKPGPDTKGDGT